MFNKILKKPPQSLGNSVFPKIAPSMLQGESKSNDVGKRAMGSSSNLPLDKIRDIIKDELMKLINEPNLVDKFEDGILQKLQKKYDFTPSDIYVQQEEQKKQYIRQLDGYLEDKKNINTQISSELQSFLSQTQNSLELALKTFTTKLNENIQAAEQKYGIAEIKEQLGLDNIDSQKVLS